MTKNSGNGTGLPTTPGRARKPGTALATSRPRQRSFAAGIIPAEGAPGTYRDQGTTLVLGQPYDAHGVIIPAQEVYYVDGSKPRQDGPWLGEADKVAWRDPSTGYECIIMRARDRGFLSGYVGIPRDHPLWGYEHQAVPADLGIEVHGGLSYSRICEEGPTPERRVIVTEARRICHVDITMRAVPTAHATDYRVEGSHAWWFGFDCNKLYDVIPGERAHGRQFLAAETGQVYRDDAYVYEEVRHLAAQLRAIADGVPVPPRDAPPPPPLGLDPHQGGRS